MVPEGRTAHLDIQYLVTPFQAIFCSAGRGCHGRSEGFPSIIRSEKRMSKEHRSSREDKKKPAMTPKEKKAAKKSKKESRNESRGLLDR